MLINVLPDGTLEAESICAFVGTMTEGHSEGKGAKEEVVLVACPSPESSSPSESEDDSAGAEVVVSVVVGTAEFARRADVGTHAYKLIRNKQ